MKYFTYLMIAFLTLSFTACDTIVPCGTSKEDFLANYKSLLDEVETENPSKDSEKWKNYDYRFKQLVEECYPSYQEELTISEKVEFVSLSSQYYVERYEGEVTVKMEEVGNILKQEYEKLMEEKGDEIEDMAEEFGEDLEKMAKKWSEKLKQLFEEE